MVYVEHVKHIKLHVYEELSKVLELLNFMRFFTFKLGYYLAPKSFLQGKQALQNKFLVHLFQTTMSLSNVSIYYSKSVECFSVRL